MKTANYEVTEVWEVTCPECDHEQPAPFNASNPMKPMEIYCEYCHAPFLLTYESE